MLDNMTIDNYGHALMQEDVGNNVHIGKIWQYSIATDNSKEIAHHDESRFISGAPFFLTQDEEASGIIDVQNILGQGFFLMVDQAHYSISGEVFEGGQILAFFNPDTYNAAPNAFSVSGGGFRCYDGAGLIINLSKSEVGVNYQLMLNGTINIGSPVAGTGSSISFGLQTTAGSYSVLGTNVLTSVSSAMTGSVVITVNPALSVDAGANQIIYSGYSPQACAFLSAIVSGGTAGYSYSWSNGSSATGINVCPSTSTVYHVTVTDSKGCATIDDVKVCTLNVVCSSCKDPVKISVCHHGKTLCVSKNAVAAHLAHGDLLGSCNADRTCGDESRNTVWEKAEISEMDMDAPLVRLYPNPSARSSVVNIEIDNLLDGNAVISVKDILGREFFSERAAVNNGHLNKQLNFGMSLETGTYILSVITGTTVITEKLIIQ